VGEKKNLDSILKYQQAKGRREDGGTMRDIATIVEASNCRRDSKTTRSQGFHRKKRKPKNQCLVGMFAWLQSGNHETKSKGSVRDGRSRLKIRNSKGRGGEVRSSPRC